MRSSLRKILSLARSVPGRVRRARAETRGQLLRRAAILYRRTLARRTLVVAVVGSFGKSTTMHAVTAALGREAHPRARFNAGDSVAQAIFRIRPFDRHAVIEVGIGEPGQMTRYARMVRPDITVVTSIGSEHHTSLKTLEVTRWEKAEMLRALPASGLAVVNGDDANVLWMRGETGARAVTFGFAPSNDVRASDFALDWPAGSRFNLHAGGATRAVRTRLIGKHMVYPFLAAAAVALDQGFTLDQILPALASVPAAPGRMEIVPLANGAIILRDDYKSSLETMDAALDAFAETAAARRIVVFGEVTEPPSSRGPLYRRLGARVAQIATRAIFIGQTQTTHLYAMGSKSAGFSEDRILRLGNRVHDAIAALRSGLGPGDAVLIKGRHTQRLERITLALSGRNVRCAISVCHELVSCKDCPMLEQESAGGSDAPPAPFDPQP